MRVFPDRDVPRGFAPIHAGVEAAAGLVAQMLEVALQILDAFDVADRSMPRHDHLRLQANYEVTRRDPVRERPGPDDRMPFVEYEVAGEDRTILLHPGNRVG